MQFALNIRRIRELVPPKSLIAMRVYHICVIQTMYRHSFVPIYLLKPFAFVHSFVLPMKCRTGMSPESCSAEHKITVPSFDGLPLSI